MSTNQAQPTQLPAQLSPQLSFAAGILQNKLNQALLTGICEAHELPQNLGDAELRNIPGRLDLAFSYFEKKITQLLPWIFKSREIDNFTYAITAMNKGYLASFCSVVTNLPVDQMQRYIDELCNDKEIRAFVTERIRSRSELPMDLTFDFGRRLGWYVVVRALKPRTVVETGVSQGLGALMLATALKRNAAEGAPGRYFGTDIDPRAGYLFDGPYREFGEILYGDSIESLKKLNRPIDVFINDSDHSAEYEAREYDIVQPMLTSRAVILGDNSHVTDALRQFAVKTGRKFLFFVERPEGHWYPGAGIGAAF